MSNKLQATFGTYREIADTEQVVIKFDDDLEKILVERIGEEPVLKYERLIHNRVVEITYPNRALFDAAYQILTVVRFPNSIEFFDQVELKLKPTFNAPAIEFIE